ncbi:hypothetical protein N8668_01765, partial [bacterium]|nr:hypothetical protein [bacterium]
SGTSLDCFTEGSKFTSVLSKREGRDCIHIDLSAHHQRAHRFETKDMCKLSKIIQVSLIFAKKSYAVSVE